MMSDELKELQVKRVYANSQNSVPAECYIVQERKDRNTSYIDLIDDLTSHDIQLS